MKPARVKHLLWYEVLGSLNFLAIVFGCAVSSNAAVASNLLVPATIVAFVHGLVGTLYVYAVQRPGARDLIRFPLWILLGCCIGVQLGSGAALGPLTTSDVGIMAWGGIAASLLGIGWVSLMMERPPPLDEGHCEECGYDLRHSTSRICPECGHENTHISSTPPFGDKSYRPWRKRT